MYSNRLMTSALLLAAIFFAPGAAFAAFSSAGMEKEVGSQGANGIYKSHPADDSEFWDAFYRCVESGDLRCLKISKEILPYSDAGAGESIVESLGMAIKKRPKEVLSLAKQVSEAKGGREHLIQDLCYSTTPNDNQYSAHEVKELKARKLALQKKLPESGERSICIEAINRRLAELDSIKKSGKK